MMTRQHFEAIAHTLNANHADLNLVLDFADMLEEQNPRFDRKRFVQASTINVDQDMRAERRRLDREAGV